MALSEAFLSAPTANLKNIGAPNVTALPMHAAFLCSERCEKQCERAALWAHMGLAAVLLGQQHPVQGMR